MDDNLIKNISFTLTTLTMHLKLIYYFHIQGPFGAEEWLFYKTIITFSGKTMYLISKVFVKIFFLFIFF